MGNALGVMSRSAPPCQLNESITTIGVMTIAATMTSRAAICMRVIDFVPVLLDPPPALIPTRREFK